MFYLHTSLKLSFSILFTLILSGISYAQIPCPQGTVPQYNQMTRTYHCQPTTTYPQPVPVQPYVQPTPAQPYVQPTPAQPYVQPTPAQPYVQPTPEQPYVQPTPEQPKQIFDDKIHFWFSTSIGWNYMSGIGKIDVRHHDDGSLISWNFAAGFRYKYVGLDIEFDFLGRTNEFLLNAFITPIGRYAFYIANEKFSVEFGVGFGITSIHDNAPDPEIGNTVFSMKLKWKFYYHINDSFRVGTSVEWVPMFYSKHEHGDVLINNVNWGVVLGYEF